MTNKQRNKISATFLFVMLAISTQLQSIYVGRNIINSLSSSLSRKTSIGLSLSALVLSAYLINKTNKARALNKLKTQEQQYSKNIKVTPNTIFAFDINDVIIKADFNKIWNIINNKVLVNYKLKLCSAFLRPYLYYIVFKEISKGGVPEQILNRISHEYPQFSDITYHGLELANAQSEVPGMFELIETLKKQGHELVLLSNVGQDKFQNKSSSIDMLKEQFPIFNLFDLEASQLTSQEDEYLKKPKPEFYNKFIAKITKKYGPNRVKDVIFVDDRIKNVQAARKLGIPSIWFTDSQDLKQKMNIN